MRTMKTNLLWGGLMMLLILTVSSCEKSMDSRAIRFKASTRPTSATKVGYSGVETGSRERIDWVAGDQIRIASDLARTAGNQDYANYTITSDITASAQYSDAELEGSGLLWGQEEQAYHFWGIYPPSAITVSGQNASAAGLTIPATGTLGTRTETSNSITYAADLSSAWMLSEKANVSEGSSNFTMLFYPAFTAFEFTLKSMENTTLTVTNFTLSTTASSNALAGTVSATAILDGGLSTFGTPTSPSSSISVSFGAGEDVTQTKSLTFTVLALPQVLENLTITFDFEKDGESCQRSLDLKDAGGTFLQFAACKKHVITGLALPTGKLIVSSMHVQAWNQDTQQAQDYTYEYSSAVFATLEAMENYRRYDTDSVYSDWDGSNVLVSYGYMNPDAEIIFTSNPGTDLRTAYCPIFRLTTQTESHVILRLVLDNPMFKFVRYEYPANSGLVADHSVSDAIDISAGTDVMTYFSIVPVQQFPLDTPEVEKYCKVTLLSVASGTFQELDLHELAINTPSGGAARLPGESSMELSFYYVGPASYGTTGYEYAPDGTRL